MPDPIADSYDRLAEEYAAQVGSELSHKPFDRAVLDRFAARVRGRGPVADLGCGPGHVARYLHDRGVQTLGVDLSPAMVAIARRRNPGLEFESGDFCRLTAPDGAWAGIVAFYAIVHLDAAALSVAFAEMHRVLQPDGVAVVAFHVGTGVVHRDELWGVPVQLDFRFFEVATIEHALIASGFAIESCVERPPYPEVEYPSRRAYALAVKARCR